MMRMHALHVCPVWDTDDGPLVGLDHYEEYGYEEQPEVLGWCNVAAIEIKGTVRPFLLTLDAT